MSIRQVDILLVALNEYQTDARSINFLNTFRVLNLHSIGIFASLGKKTPEISPSNAEVFHLSLSKFKRLTPNWIEFCSKASLLVNKFAPRVVFAEDLYSLPIAYLFKKKFNSKIIYDSREIYSELASTRNKKIRQRILANIEKSYIPFVDTIIVTGGLDKEILLEKYPFSTIEIVYNYPSRPKNLIPIDIRKILELPKNSIILVYQGMIFEGRGLELAIKSIKHLDNAHLVVLGRGGYRTKLENLAKTLGVINRIHFLGEVQYSQLLNYTSGADIGLTLIEPISLSYKLALPNKLFEYCQAKIPIIATKLPAIERIFEKFKIGELVEPDISAENLSKVIINTYKNRDIYASTIAKASSIFVWESQIPLIEQILTKK